MSPKRFRNDPSYDPLSHPFTFTSLNSSEPIRLIEPSGGASGQASDIAIHAREILRVRENLTKIYTRHCRNEGESLEDGMQRFGNFPSFKKIFAWRSDVLLDLYNYSDCPRTRSFHDRSEIITLPHPETINALILSFRFTAQEALDFGIVDKILESRPRQAAESNTGGSS
jgi:hypothetical protein